MTATYAAGRQYEAEVPTSGGFLAKLILMAVLILGGWAAAPIAAAVLHPAPEVPVTTPVRTGANTLSHTKKHADAQAIRQCLNDKGASQVWQSKSWRQPNTFFRVCDLGDGRVGVMLVKWAGRAGVWRETTSFVIKDGRPQQALEYLSGKARLVYGG